MNARKQLARIERFGEVIVGPQLQTEGPVERTATRGEHDHGDIFAGRAQVLQRAQAVTLGHHDVEQNHRRTLEFEPAQQRRAVVKHRDLHTVGMQQLTQQVAHDGIVVDQKNMQTHEGILANLGSAQLTQGGRTLDCRYGRVLRRMLYRLHRLGGSRFAHPGERSQRIRETVGR